MSRQFSIGTMVQRCLVFVLFLMALSVNAAGKDRPNVLLIICDDLNDYVQTFGGHPQVKTPNITRLVESGVSFHQAHCNIPICNPSRASMMTGLYPHTSGVFGFEHWDENEVLKNSRTMMDHFRANGYHTLGTGKVIHNRDRKEWKEYGHPSDYGPFFFEGGDENLAHPDVPLPFREEFGAIDGSFGPLRKLAPGEKGTWRTGGWAKQRDFRYVSDQDRDLTGDELNADWAVKRLNELGKSKNKKPFFMGIGFVRPHTPLIVPQEYFDRFPLDSIELADIGPGDAEDTFKHTVVEADGDRGSKIYNSLLKSYEGNRDLALKKFIQAYLASVASVDDLVGEVLDALESSGLDRNTIVVFTSDHGWGMGEKDHLYKNSLWKESTRVPLVVRAPGVSKEGGVSDRPVSLVDVYPTLLDLCHLPTETTKNSKGHALDGHSLKPFLVAPDKGSWSGPDAALTALYKWANYYDPALQSYSLRFEDWRYIRYGNGKEELYQTNEDPNEWTNLAGDLTHQERIKKYRAQLLGMIPSRPQEDDAESWKDTYFRKNPAADSNKDGKLTWPEFQAHKKMVEAAKEKKPSTNKRLQTTGVFTKAEDKDAIFTDSNGGQNYYVIQELNEQIEKLLDKEVRVVATVKPTKTGAGKLMVYISTIKLAKNGE